MSNPTLTPERLAELIDHHSGCDDVRVCWEQCPDLVAALTELQQARARIAELEPDLRVAQTASTLGQPRVSEETSHAAMPRYRVGDRVWIVLRGKAFPGAVTAIEITSDRTIYSVRCDSGGHFRMEANDPYPDRASAEAAVKGGE